jgi:hypothetical protein
LWSIPGFAQGIEPTGFHLHRLRSVHGTHAEAPIVQRNMNVYLMALIEGQEQ